MEYRVLGRTGLRVSSYSLGTANFGPWGNDDEQECGRLLHEALDAGVNLIDTADVYGAGRSEEILGRALKRRRDEVILATKLHNPMGSGVNDGGNSRLWVMRAVEGSLRRLETDHIDLYQIHRPDPSTDVEDTLAALTELVRQGKVRYIGSSTFPSFLLLESLWASERRKLEGFACEQPPYSIFVRHVEEDVLPLAQRRGLGILAWSPLAGGWLSGKYRIGREMPNGSRGDRAVMPYMAPRFDLSLPGNQRKLELVNSLAKVADTAGLALPHMALAFALAHPAVTSIIIGPRTVAQLRELLLGMDVRLDDDTLDAIDGIVPPGTTLNPADRGWDPPWMAPEARRR
ncbi:MAG TPA: aldo/keto reductase [Actinomycetota bacterium]|jgi:aryl-alcohol dehydrogenase-like predicted oxidoreductase